MAGPTSSPRSAANRGDGPLIGRAGELERIAQARTERLSGVVILAGAGVGKSRLARSALTQAEHDGAMTAWVQATRSAASVPLGAFAGVIPMEVRSDDLFELLRGSAAALRNLAGTRSLVVGIDDAQLLDQTSAALALHLATGGETFVLATVRTGEPCPDAVVSLWKDAGGRTLELTELGEQETAQLMESIVDGQVEQGARRWVWETSRGNPLYVRELVRGALDSGALEQVNGLWRMSRRPPLSNSLAEVISARLAGLDSAQRHVLELLALGEPLRVADLVALADADAASAAETLGLITISGSDDGGEVRLSHPLYGETLRVGLGILRASRLRLALAARFQMRGELTPSECLRVARWLLDAGETIPTGLLIEAARAANRAGDPVLGAQLAADARAAGGGAEAGLLLARAHAIRSRFEDAEAVLVEVEAQLETREQAADYLQQQGAVLSWGLPRPAELSALLRRAETWWPDDGWQRRLEPLRVWVAAQNERYGATLEASAAALADPELDDETRRQLEPLHVGNLFWRGRTREAFEQARRMRPAVPLRDLSDEVALALWITIPIDCGYALAELDEWMSDAVVQSVRAGDHATAGLAARGLGRLRLLDGRLLDAKRWLLEAELQVQQHDAFGALASVLADQARVAAAAQDADGACAALARCRAILGGREPLPHELPHVAGAEASVKGVLGDRQAAQELLLQAAEQLAWAPVYSAELTYHALLAGAPARRIAERLRALRPGTDAPLIAAYAAHARALADRDGTALIEVAGDFERIGALRYATAAAADAARAFMAQGRQDSARRAADRSRELFALGQGGVAPVIDGLDGPAVELTAREAQLVDLARQGFTNPQIAERLVLSTRTVESHLYRAMRKLGVSDRRNL